MISYNRFLELGNKNCHYCGKTPSNTSRSGFRYQGVDRIDSNRGYPEDNVVPCCSMCNGFKSDKPQQAFLDHALAIVIHSFSSYEIEHALWKKAEEEESL